MVWFNGRKNINWVEGIYLVMGAVFIFSVVLILDTTGQVFAQSNPEEKSELNVFNPVGTPIGSVDEAGRVYNRLGRIIGSVDDRGIIYNISKNPIGKVAAGGKVFNRVGTLVGSVDDKGNVFNNNGRNIGSVKPPYPGNVILIGGAAWLLLLGVR